MRIFWAALNRRARNAFAPAGRRWVYGMIRPACCSASFATIVIFFIAYIAFQRQEIRA